MIKNILLDMIEELENITKKNGLQYTLAYGSLLGAVREKGLIKWDNEIDIWVKQKDYEKFVEIVKNNLSSKYEVSTPDDQEYELYFSRINLANKSHHSLHIDIFPLVGLPNEMKKIKQYVNRSYILNKMFYIKRLNIKEHYWKKRRFKRYYQALISKILLLIVPDFAIKYLLDHASNEYNLCSSEYFYTFGGSYKMREVFASNLMKKIVYVDFEHLKLPIFEAYDDILTQVYGDYMTPKKKNYLA